jgi:hypothetical protein
MALSDMALWIWGVLHVGAREDPFNGWGRTPQTLRFLAVPQLVTCLPVAGMTVYQ